MAIEYGSRPYRASPRARRMAEELRIPLEDMEGTAPSGHIIERDVVECLEKRGAETVKPEYALPRLTPLAKRISEVEGINSSEVNGTGFGGKITGKDVLRLLERTAGNRVEKSAYRHTENSGTDGTITDIRRMAGMRKTIAERMRHSWNTVPHVTLTTEAEVTELVAWREVLLEQADREQGLRVTLTDLIVKACASAIRLHPYVNVTLEDGMMHYHNEVHIGIAVALEDGLLVPVIRNADHKSLVEIAAESRKMISRARSGGLRENDVTGGKFTVSNLGSYDIDAFTPIINLPEAAILGVGRVAEKLCVKQGTIRIGKTMVLSLSFDHRVLDGAPAASFLQSIKQNLENPTGGWM